MSEGQAEGQPTAESIGALLAEPEGEQEEQQAEETEGEEIPAEGEESEESEEQEEQEGEEKPEPTFTIKHDGQEVTLKQSELTELAQKGFDYTKKTMALADERKTIETEREHVRGEAEQVTQTREQAVEDLRAITNFLSGIIGAPPDVSLAQQDASLYLAQKAHHDQLRDKLSQAQQALGIAAKELEAERQRQNAAKQARTEKVLIDTLPGWKDNPQQKFSETARYLESLGLNGKNAGSAALEPGFWQMAVKAKAFDDLQQKKVQSKPAAKPGAKVAAPNAANPVNAAQSAHKAKLERYKSAPSLESLGALM